MGWLMTGVVVLGLVMAAAPGLRAEECFCLANVKTGATLRGCEAYKAPGDFYPTAVCTDPEIGVRSEQTMVPDWQRIEEGDDRCTPCRPAEAAADTAAERSEQQADGDRAAASATTTGSPALVTASRIFASPKRYPPTDFAAYGILAFPSRPSPFTRNRYLMFCHAYLAVLPHESELDVPRAEQMVTVWPLRSDEACDRLNRARDLPQDACEMAVDDYGLVIAQQALKEAKLSGRNVSGGGPFLLAWSPAANKGKPGAPVLVSDLSDITTYEQAHERLLAWSRDIESDPAVWTGGWNLERIRVHIRNWVDKYGEKSLAFLVEVK